MRVGRPLEHEGEGGQDLGMTSGHDRESSPTVSGHDCGPSGTGLTDTPQDDTPTQDDTYSATVNVAVLEAIRSFPASSATRIS